MRFNLRALATTCVLVSVFSHPSTIRAQVRDPGASHPRFILRIKPEYPEAALAREQSGRVTVEFTVSETGGVRDVVVVESSDAIFEPPTLTALQRRRYEPKDAGSRIRETVEFRSSTATVLFRDLKP